MVLMLLGLVLFLGIHSVRMVAPQFRLDRIAAMGEGGWKGVYSLASLAGIALIVLGWRSWDAPPVLYVTSFGMVHVAMLLTALAFVSFMVGNLPSGRLKPILKHPQLLAVKLWATAHLLVNGDLASIILFGSFLGWAVWNRIAVKRRGGALPQPGPVMYDAVAVVVGLAVWALFVWKLHEYVAGVPVPFA
jgi:uncharacterized membrane protein